MKDAYVGDIGDFANNGLLRHLCGMTGPPMADEKPLRLGVAWYLTPENVRFQNGGTVGFLVRTVANLERFRQCDFPLYDKLEHLVISHRRNVKATRRARILPCNTLYHETPLINVPRADWFEGALESTREADLVFVNPDNGIDPQDGAGDSKYVYMDELRQFWDRGQSLVIYQHRPQRLRVDQEYGQFANWVGRLRGALAGPLFVRVLRWNRIQVRFYLIVPRPCHRAFLDQRIEALIGSNWCNRGHFTVER